MKYHAPTKQYVVARADIETASFYMLHALRNIREMAGLPLTKYERTGGLEPHDYAQKNIIDAAAKLGIDLGAEWGNQLDLTE